MAYDAALPFFAYGMFMPGELGWLRVRDHVATVQASSTIRGELLERDGLVVLDAEGSARAAGMILHFRDDVAGDAYRAIDELEPNHQYTWQVVEAKAPDATTTVNALVGRSPRKGSTPLEGPWSGRTDPLFTEGLLTVEALIQESGDVGLPAFFRTQAAYLLLWSIVERYATFRYSLAGDSVAHNLQSVAGDPAFRGALRTHVVRADRIQRTDRPSHHETLDPDHPVKSIRYYYQLRSNVAHRGKAAIGDQKRLKASCRELLQVFQDVLQQAFDEASRAFP